MATDEQVEGLRVDVDTRLTDLWMVVLDPDSPLLCALEDNERARNTMGEALRVAYTKGYLDALREDKAGRRAELHKTHGYRPE